MFNQTVELLRGPLCVMNFVRGGGGYVDFSAGNGLAGIMGVFIKNVTWINGGLM